MKNFTIRQKIFLVFALLIVALVGNGIYFALSLPSNQSRSFLFVSLAVVVLISVFMATTLTKSILTPIKKLSDAMEELAAGNLTVEVHSKSNDELGQLINTFSNTVEKFRLQVENIHQNAKDAAIFAAQLNEHATKSASATQQVSASIENVAENAVKQEDAISRSSRDIRAFAELLQ